ncbi:MAG: dihydroorotate dehydrogenase [Candidatus Diapherotrites archaeon]|jgi:dihydroorotate dehydrogenase subfamily 1|uniref:Dihydroorotate dehydrogenase n=1 Tax=Candidatus Iainarchaeum sp. TaxID=3101447 RepID=A0A8T5GEK2_9ARCH|nr:dihydroorotate dehydrogenase [Candidatus Diapherotrites archaeon]MBT7240912.1 dihydroorotate dehydrogenase [Candidatus Diapherotrites archaeon]
MKTNFMGKEISGQFTIPSGIVTTNTKVIKKIMEEIPEIGIITTKSIGPEQRAGNREPIITQYAPGCFMNAVGLTNPGYKEFAKQLSELKIPKDKFLLISIFGGNEKEFVEVAKELAPYADALELNLSCPHAKGYGMAIGQDPVAVKEIVSAVKKAVSIPVIPKLTPNTNNLGEISKAAVEGGADGICAINTVGPGEYTVNGSPVLTNKKGGMSGRGVLPIGLKCVKEIREAVDVPIIGCGGISVASDVIAYKDAGANIFGIGSTLAGMSTKEMKEYFAEIEKDIENETNNAISKIKKIDMDFKKFKLVKNEKLADDFSVLTFDEKINVKPGQFFFVWIPGKGEKPFSALDDNPLTLAVHNVGCFTKELVNLTKGAEVFFRGPYGNEVNVEKKEKIIVVGGGTGVASVYQIARDYENTEFFFGARDKDHLYYTDKIKESSPLFISTNDGSVGEKGFVTEILAKRLEELKGENMVFFNCGPLAMIEAVVQIEKQYASEEKIFSSIELMTKCGIGICGACANKKGKRLCVDGPYFGEEKCE